jgi:hypothetical protein
MKSGVHIYIRVVISIQIKHGVYNYIHCNKFDKKHCSIEYIIQSIDLRKQNPILRLLRFKFTVLYYKYSKMSL